MGIFVLRKKYLDYHSILCYNLPQEVSAMTLLEAKILLERKRIPYQTAQYENEAAYWRHCTSFPYTDSARNCKITALVIPAVNGVKNIELQFSRLRGEYVFDEMWFGGYCFELYEQDPDLLEADILDFIGQIVDGKLTVIEVNDLKKKRWKSSLCFDPTDSDDVFGAPGLRAALEKIEAPKSLWKKLTGSSVQYDIYDWRTYRQIVK